MTSNEEVRGLLAGLDTGYYSADVNVSEEVYRKLEGEKEAAQLADRDNRVHCPDWLGAQMMPTGAGSGYTFLIQSEDFAVKVCNHHLKNRPGLYIELRSHFLHTHPEGARGACEEALCWVREQLCYDLDAQLVAERVSFPAVKLSRGDVHFDYQGGWCPSLANVSADLRRFIRPGKVKWGLYGEGIEPTGYTFGHGNIRARLYNKSVEARTRNDDGYFALLAARNGERFNSEQDVWRLEFQLRREGAKGFRLYAEPDAGDDDAAIDAELAAEEFEHIGSLPRFFARMPDLFDHLTWHWLRLVEDNGSANRSRWPLHPTWAAIRAQFPMLLDVAPLDDDTRLLVRGSRYSGKSRLLRRMAVGVTSALEVEDASPASASIAQLEQWATRLADREEARAKARRERYEAKYGYVPRWVEKGMGARLERAKQVKHKVQMLLGIFAARGVLPLELKPAYNIADLLEQHILDLEDEAEQKGGVGRVLIDHFAKVYKVPVPANLFTDRPKAVA